jgi:5-methylcytosine-specific restriction endonuclease McrA
MQKVNCKNCNRQFKEYASRIKSGHGKYCSKKCLLAGREKTKKTHKCLVCSILFYTKNSRIKTGRGKFCSTKCYTKSKEGMVGFWKNKTRSTPWMEGAKNHMWTGGFVTTHYARQKGVGGKHTQTEWEQLKKRYSHSCLCCKKQEPFIKLTKDHVVPLKMWNVWAVENNPQYMGNSIQNIQPLCLECNSRKNANLVDYRKKTLWSVAV